MKTEDKFIKEAEFDQKLKEIGDAYETIKDYFIDTDSADNELFEMLKLLRDTAAIGLQNTYKIRD